MCVDGHGREYLGKIARLTSKELTVRIDRAEHTKSLGAEVWLACALVKGERFDWMVQKTAELGVARVSPLLTERTVVRLTDEQGQRKRARWQRIAEEAVKQCGRSTLPLIEPPCRFERFLPRLRGTPLVLIPTLEAGTVPLQEALKKHHDVKKVAVLIGPEGDFSREEIASAVACGAQPVSLGPLTLRTETAALAVLAVLSYELQRG